MARTLRATVVVGVLTAATLTACSWGAQEPGLFKTPAPSLAPVPSLTVDTAPPPTNPELPVAGEAVWTTGDGTGVTVRFAVHAVRRTEDATVLDWSVTPLAERLHPQGSLLPSGTDLGVPDTPGGGQELTLLDVAGRRAYRPLVRTEAGQVSHCLCTPMYAVTPTLRMGDTRLLQTAFPALPAAVTTVDVALPNVAVLAGVPVSAVGTVPTPRAPVDLARANLTVTPATYARTYVEPGPAHRRETVRVDRVVAAPGLTSIEWTLHSLDEQSSGGASLDEPPTARPLPSGVRVTNRSPADGPRARMSGGPWLSARWTGSTVNGLPAYTCLCSELDLWAKSLRSAGGTVRLVTTLPGIAPGIAHVDVEIPGVPVFDDVLVVHVPDGAAHLGSSVRVSGTTWAYLVSAPPPGWTTQEWPTPVPDPRQVDGYRGSSERLLPAIPRQ